MTKPLAHQYLFLNGPPGSGKDTAANFILREYPIECRHMKLAMPLKQAVRSMFLMRDDLWQTLERIGAKEEKDKPRDEFYGMSWREVLIWMSEEAMKPKFGDGIFGELFGKQSRASTGCTLTVCSDGGFLGEISAAARHIGARNIHIIRLHRPGCDFSGDSRDYLEPAGFEGYHVHDINNVHELDMFRRQVLIRVNRIMGGERTYD